MEAISAMLKAVASDPHKIQNAKKEVCIEHRQTKVIAFSNSKILRGTCLDHLENCTIYTGMDMDTGELFIIKELLINGNEKVKEEMSQYLTDLMQLRHHNLLELQNVTCVNINENKWTFYVLQEFMFGSTCFSLFLTKSIGINMDMLKHIAVNILFALEYLKSNGVLEVNLTASSIYITPEGNVKLTDFGMKKTLPSSTLRTLDDCDAINQRNIYNFRILLLSLFTGKIISCDEMKLFNSLPKILQEFLASCSTGDKQEQVTISRLLNHPFLDSNEWKVPEIGDLVPIPETLHRSRSRVENDFTILESLGKGAFGEVYKVKNKLDGREYALKKIKLNPHNEKLNEKLRREVQILSLLKHENIVRYYTSWTDIEDVLETDTDSSEFDEDDAASIDNIECSFLLESTSNGLDYYYDDFKIITNIDEKSETNSENSDEMLVTPVTIENDMALVQLNPKQILYIQMEFCRSNTLRDAIDSGFLYDDVDRIWKFLREIVAGLVHIHEQGIIHRDLKPMNIFLDSSDHIKIGDFGLATTNIRYKKNLKNKNESNFLSPNENKVGNGSSTSEAGTEMYKAPELKYAHLCDGKLDMYSLGIILFEMCYKRPNTDSERYQVLMKLRSKEIVFPEEFKSCTSEKQQEIIRDLLNHNPMERPSSKELLKSNCIPPILEEEQLQEMFKRVTENRHLKSFQYLMDCCFIEGQEEQNIRYHGSSDMYKNISELEIVGQNIISIFRKHGGQNVSMPTVIPQNSCSPRCKYCFKLMTRSGTIVLMPCNSRIPFAQYVALNKNITWLRRYSVDKLTRMLVLPLCQFRKEIFEYVFDIITPINLGKLKNFLPDAEILQIIYEIRKSLHVQPNVTLTLNINHSLLIKAIFLECEILNEEYFESVTYLLTSATRLHRQIMLSNYVSDSMCSKLIELTDISYPMSKSDFILQHFTVPEARDIAEKGLKEMKCITETAVLLGVTCSITLKAGLLHNFKQYSGMLVELTGHSKKNKYVLVTGGRYDTIIEQFQKSAFKSQKSPLIKCGVGISVNVENLCKISEMKNFTDTFEVVVCSFSSKAVLGEKAKILQALWSNGIRCSFIKASKMKHLKMYCKCYNVSYALILTQKNIEKGNITLGQWKNRWTTFAPNLVKMEDVITIMRGIISDCKFNPLPMLDSTHVDCVIPIIFKTSQKLSPFAQLKWRVQIYQKTQICQQRLHGNTIIIATDIDMHIISDFATSVKFESGLSYTTSRDEFAIRYPSQYNHLQAMCQDIYDTKIKKGHLNLILYNLKESKFFIHLL